jgi:integrase
MLAIQSKAGKKFLDTVGQSNESTARTYAQYITAFDEFCHSSYGVVSDTVIEVIKKGQKPDAYDVLSAFMAYVRKERKVSTNTLRFFVKCAKNFLEFNDVVISNVQFKLKVRIPRRITRQKEAIDIQDIRTIINACSDIRAKTYFMFLAATGTRATEALSLRLKDLDLVTTPGRANIRAEYTKTRTDRYVFLTGELRQQLKLWLDHKYRTYRSCYYVKGKSVSEYVQPKPRPTDLVFAVYHKDGTNPELLHMYQDLRDDFQATLKRAGMLEYEDSATMRMKITLHSFRRFVKTTISNLGKSDYSEWFLGHAGSTYWRAKDSEKISIFKDIQSYLTFMDFTSLEAQGQDIATQIETIKNQEISNLKDVITTLSDRLADVEKQLKSR